MIRVFQILIVLFWLTTTALLVKHAYFPEESRFPRVERQYVANLFFKEPRQSDLSIVKDGISWGRLTITPRPSITKPPLELQNPTELREVFFSGYLHDHTKDELLGKMSWNGSLYVDKQFGAKAMRIQLRAPNVGASGYAIITLDPPDVRYQLKQGREVFFDSADPDGNSETANALKALAQTQGQEIGEFPMLGNPEQLVGMLESFEPKVDCRHGRFTLVDERYDGYLVTLNFMEEWKLRFYISELGELLKVDGIPNIEILGDAFVPEEQLPV
ncbi:MAG: hypothetical protein AAF585_17130 [Verrucomicrobiota bacterium]